MDELKLYRPEEAAKILGNKVETLASMRSAGTGPPWFKIKGVGIRYEHAMLKAWVLGQQQGCQTTRPATRRAGRPRKMVI